MSKSARMLSVTAGAVTAAALLAACTGSAGTGKPAPPTGATAAPSSGSASGSATDSRTAAQPSDSTGASGSTSSSALKQALLRAGDLPSTWKATPPDTSDDSSDDDTGFDKSLGTCIGITIPTSADDDAGTVHSPDFKNGDNEIYSDAKPARDVEKQKRFNEKVINSPKTDGCFAKTVRALLSKQAPAGASLGDVSVRVTGRQSGQPSSVQVNFAAKLTLSVQGQTVPVFITFVDVLTDRVEAELNFNGLGAEIPASIRDAAVAAVASRAK